MADALEDPGDHSPTAVEALRARVHRMSDMLQIHELTLREQVVLLTVVRREVDTLRSSMATREQLQSLHDVNTLKLETFSNKLDNLSARLTPIQNGIYWAVALIIGAVLFAIMTLVLNGPPPHP